MDTLNAYLTAQDTEDAAFIHHGSLVPTQFISFWAEPYAVAVAVAVFLPQATAVPSFPGREAGELDHKNVALGLDPTLGLLLHSGGWDDYIRRRFTFTTAFSRLWHRSSARPRSSNCPNSDNGSAGAW